MGASDFACVTRGELLKLWKRPAFHVILLIAGAFVLVQYYIVSYLVYRTSDPGSHPAPDIVMGGYSLNQVVRIVIVQVSTEGPIIGIVLGAVLAGSEYNWGTMRTALMQRAGKLSLFVGQAVALLVAASAVVAIVFLSGGVGSVAVTLLSGFSVTAPQYSWLLRGVADSLSIIAMWTMWGAFWATLLRGIGPGIAAAFVWTMIDGFLSQVYPLSPAIAAVDKAMPTSITLAILLSFPPPGQVGNQLPVGLSAASASIGPWILLAYIAGLMLAGAIVVRRRDVG